MAQLRVHDLGSRKRLPEVIEVEDEQMTPEKVTPPKKRRMSFPKLNVKKLRARFAPAPGVGY